MKVQGVSGVVLTLEDIATATGGDVVGAAPGGASGLRAAGVSTDTRSLAPGEVFFALRGPRFDGHAFVAEAASKGAASAVVESTDGLGGLPSGFALVVVGDTTRALGDLAARVRRQSGLPVVAISGSSGKTTTKEMAASILSVSRKVLKTRGNLNNHIGLPLTLLGLMPEHEAAVVELGISRPGEMARLVEIASPDVALLTNIGRAHALGLGDPEGVAEAKGEIFSGLAAGGVKAVNLDDPLIVEAARRSPGGMAGAVTFGSRGEADVRVADFRPAPDLSGSTATYDVRGERLSVRFASPAAACAMNGAAAIASALSLGAGPGEITGGLGAFNPLKGRMEVVRARGMTLIDDTYNANPDSVASALKTLGAVNGRAGRKVVVLGDMLELGHRAERAHREAGRMAASIKAAVVVAVGTYAAHTAEGAVEGGVPASEVYEFGTKEEALGALAEIAAEGDLVLVKGSRGAELEDIVAGLSGLE